MKAVPLGIEFFKEIVNGNYYYVDKTLLIKELLAPEPAKATLITRPRRFGKSLNMNMLNCFLNIEDKEDIFTDLKIRKEKEICERHMHKYPVIQVSFKDISGISLKPDPRNVENALRQLSNTIGTLADTYSFLENSAKLTDKEKEDYEKLCARSKDPSKPMFVINTDVLQSSLLILSTLLHKHYGIPAVILIDEYDVPLDKAYLGGYYDEFMNIYRNLLSSALKSNPHVAFAVITGCLRISKESIFTGLNNLTTLDITNSRADEYFGFTDEEVLEMLKHYHLERYHSKVKAFYDGYRIGNKMVYNPWSIIDFISNAIYEIKNDIEPSFPSGWVNSSGNDIIRMLLNRADENVKMDLEELSSGKTVGKHVVSTLSYPDLYSDLENIWTVMLHAGYLTTVRKIQDDIVELRIPNEEVQRAFDENVRKWANKRTEQGTYLKQLCESVETFEAGKMEESINILLDDLIGARDTATKTFKENYYHGIMNCAVSYRTDWISSSNPETGDGYCDLAIENRKENWGMILELKYSSDPDDFTKALDEGEKLIYTCRYAKMLERRKYKNIYLYSIAFHGRECRVRQVPYPKP